MYKCRLLLIWMLVAGNQVGIFGQAKLYPAPAGWRSSGAYQVWIGGKEAYV